MGTKEDRQKLMSLIRQSKEEVDRQILRQQNFRNEMADVDKQITILQNKKDALRIKIGFTKKDLEDARNQMEYFKKKFWEENLK